MKRVVRALLSCLAAVLVLAGCSQDADSPDGGGRVEIGDTGLALELPTAWVELDPAEAREALEDDALMTKLVTRHGSDTEDNGPVKTFISTTAVPPPGPAPIFAASAKGTGDGVLPQMTAKVLGLDALPSAAELEESYRDHPLGIDYLDVTEIDTAVGPAVLVSFSTKARNPDMHWAELTVDSGSDVIDISVLTAERPVSAQLASMIAASLERIP